MAGVFDGFIRRQRVTSKNVLQVMRRALQQYSWNVRDEYCQIGFGMSYKDFQKFCGKLPPALAATRLNEIEKLPLQASILIAGFISDRDGDPEPFICKIPQKTRELSIAEHFDAIGDGAIVAVPSLKRREYDSDVPIHKAIYQLYEAKTLAETIGSVGTATSIDVIYPSGKKMSLRTKKKKGEKDGYDYYLGLMKKLGPKPNVTGIKWDEAYLEPFEDSDKGVSEILIVTQPSPKSKSQKSKSKR